MVKVNMETVDRRARPDEAGWLRQQLAAREISVRTVAANLDVLPQTVYNWDSGKSRVPDDQAAQIAKILGMDEIELRGGLGLWVPPEPQQEPAPETPEGPLDRELPAELLKNPDFMAKWGKVPRRKKRWLIKEMRRRGEERRREERENIVMLVDMASDEPT